MKTKYKWMLLIGAVLIIGIAGYVSALPQPPIAPPGCWVQWDYFLHRWMIICP